MTNKGGQTEQNVLSSIMGLFPNVKFHEPELETLFYVLGINCFDDMKSFYLDEHGTNGKFSRMFSKYLSKHEMDTLARFCVGERRSNETKLSIPLEESSFVDKIPQRVQRRPILKKKKKSSPFIPKENMREYSQFTSLGFSEDESDSDNDDSDYEPGFIEKKRSSGKRTTIQSMKKGNQFAAAKSKRWKPGREKVGSQDSKGLDGDYWNKFTNEREKLKPPKPKVLKFSSMKLQNMDIIQDELMSCTVCEACFLGRMIMVDETGTKILYSEIIWQCNKCGFTKTVPTSLKVTIPASVSGKSRQTTAPAVNLQYVVGATGGGVKNRSGNILLPHLGLSTYNRKSFRNNQDKIGNSVEKILNNSQDHWLEKEIEITKEKKNPFLGETEDGKQELQINFDTGYGNRRGRQKNSITGSVTGVGKYTKKVVGSAQYCKKCKKCDYNKRNSIVGQAAEHDCAKNLPENISSARMEPEGIVKIVKDVEESGKAFVKIIGGDDDNAGFAKVQKELVHGTKRMKKSDKNHLPVFKWIVELKGLEVIFSESVALKVKKITSRILESNRNDLEACIYDLTWAYKHIQGIHNNFGEKREGCRGWCPHKGKTQEEDLLEKHYLRVSKQEAIVLKMYVFERMVRQIQKLFDPANTNHCELVNWVVTSVSDKRVYHGGSKRYRIEIQTGVTLYNEGLKCLIDIGVVELKLPESQINRVGVNQLIHEQQYQKKYVRVPENARHAQFLKNNRSKTKASAQSKEVWDTHSHGIAFDIPDVSKFENDRKSIFPNFKVAEFVNLGLVWKRENEGKLAESTIETILRTFFSDTEGTGGREKDTITEIALKQLFSPVVGTYARPDFSDWTYHAIKISGIRPTDRRILIAPSSKQVAEETIKRAKEISLALTGKPPIFAFKNASYDESMIETVVPTFSKECDIVDVTKILAKVPEEVCKGSNGSQENMNIFFLRDGNRSANQHSGTEDTSQLVDLSLLNVRSDINLLADLLFSLTRSKEREWCKCPKKTGKCIKCKCTRHIEKKCSINCGCHGFCQNGNTSCRRLQKAHKQLLTEKIAIFQKKMAINPMSYHFKIKTKRKMKKKKVVKPPAGESKKRKVVKPPAGKKKKVKKKKVKKKKRVSNLEATMEKEDEEFEEETQEDLDFLDDDEEKIIDDDADFKPEVSIQMDEISISVDTPQVPKIIVDLKAVSKAEKKITGKKKKRLGKKVKEKKKRKIEDFFIKGRSFKGAVLNQIMFGVRITKDGMSTRGMDVSKECRGQQCYKYDLF